MSKKIKVRSLTISPLEGDDNREEKVRVYQKDGQTVSLRVGEPQTLTESLFWVADRAKEIGDINNFIEFEKVISDEEYKKLVEQGLI